MLGRDESVSGVNLCWVLLGVLSLFKKRKKRHQEDHSTRFWCTSVDGIFFPFHFFFFKKKGKIPSTSCTRKIPSSPSFFLKRKKTVRRTVSDGCLLVYFLFNKRKRKKQWRHRPSTSRNQAMGMLEVTCVPAIMEETLIREYTVNLPTSISCLGF